MSIQPSNEPKNSEIPPSVILDYSNRGTSENKGKKPSEEGSSILTRLGIRIRVRWFRLMNFLTNVRDFSEIFQKKMNLTKHPESLLYLGDKNIKNLKGNVKINDEVIFAAMNRASERATKIALASLLSTSAADNALKTLLQQLVHNRRIGGLHGPDIASMTHEQLRVFCQNVKVLDLPENYKIQDLIKIFPNLKNLSITNPTNQGVLSLRDGSGLRSLTIRHCDQDIWEGLESLKGLSTLKLYGGDGIADKTLGILKKLPHLTYVSIDNCPKITVRGWGQLGDIQKLETLHLRQCATFTGAAWKSIWEKTNVQQRIKDIFFADCGFTPKAWKEYLRCKMMIAECDGDLFKEDFFEQIRDAIKKSQVLSRQDKKIYQDRLTKLGQSNSVEKDKIISLLQEVQGKLSKLSGEELRAGISQLENIESLVIDQVGDASKFLQRLPESLEKIVIEDCFGITGESLMRLPRGLKTLEIINSPNTDVLSIQDRKDLYKEVNIQISSYGRKDLSIGPNMEDG